MNPSICTAATNITRHARIDVRIRWIGDIIKQRSRAHHLAGLAVAALWHVVLQPCLLYWVISVFGQAFYRCDRAVAGGNGLYRHLAGAHRYAVDVNSAGAALANPTAKFCTDVAELIADGPEKWGFGVYVYLVGFTVYID